MPAMTSPFSALRFSGRLMVIQSACPRCSVITALVSVIARSLPWLLFSGHLRQLGRKVQGQSAARRRFSASTQTCGQSKRVCGSGRDRFPDPDLVVVESGAADRRDRVRARQHVDAAVTDMVLVGMNGLRD